MAKVVFGDPLIDARKVARFVESALEFCKVGPKEKKQSIAVFSIFLTSTDVALVPWENVYKALGWSEKEQALNSKKSTLVDSLKAICLTMCYTYDPHSGGLYNRARVGIRAKRGQGLELAYIKRAGGETIEEFIFSRLESRHKRLTRRDKRDGDELEELLALRKQLQIDPNKPPLTVGPYKIQELIGEGGTAHVYLARHPYTNEEVAIKILNLDRATDPSQRERFFRGSQAMRRLQSEFVVRVFDLGDLHQGVPYYVSEFIDGSTLAEHIEDNNLSIEEKISVLTQTILGLIVAHEGGIVHQDIKPENILVDSEVRVKITDFDSSYVPDLHSLTMTTTAGTMRYFSPERRQDLSYRAFDEDVFALGVVALELLSGERLTPLNDLLKKVKNELQHPWLQNFLIRCVSPVGYRFGHAKELFLHWKAALNQSKFVIPLPFIISDFGQRNFRGIKAKDADFSRKFLTKSDFSGADLQQADFEMSALSNSMIIGSDLRGSNFDGTYMIGCRIFNSELSGTSFRRANLERTVWDEVDLEGVDFTGANLWGAFLENAKNFEKAIIDDANFSRNRLSHKQAAYLEQKENIHTYDEYGGFMEHWISNESTLYEEYWWFQVIYDNELMMCFY